MKKLILAEKPSVGRDIARGLGGKFDKKDGFLESDSYIVSWAFGHLIELCSPEEHDEKWGKWSYDTLPVLPDSFRYKPTKSGIGQFRVIKDLIARKDVESVVNCGDPGREGELIQRLILFKAGCKKPVLRFWTSKALTPEAVQEGFSRLYPSANYDRLYDSALARQQADWIVGMSCSRAVSLAIGGKGNVYSIGRVQTPVLRIIVDRENEIRNFVPQDYWTLAARFHHAGGDYEGRWFPGKGGEDRDEGEIPEESASEDKSFRIKTEAEAVAIAKKVEGATGSVLSVEKKDKADAAPLLFSLTTLQQEMNRRHGFSAQKTLDVAQTLYEEKQILSYPRTESQHLNEEMAGQCQDVLRRLRMSGIPFSPDKCTVSAKNKRVFDSAKLTDHHALIPLGWAAGLTDDQTKLFETVARRFIAAFYPPYKYKTTRVVTGVESHQFLSQGKIVSDPGWREVWGSIDKDADLPPLAAKDPVKTGKATIEAKKTVPPSRYSDASILAAMANAARFVTDAELKKVLKETSGLGTPATRAAILQTLIDRGYIERSKKTLVPTGKGMHLIESLRGEKIADPAYTALWEQTLDEIASGRAGGLKEFRSAVASDVTAFVGRAQGIKRGPGAGVSATSGGGGNGTGKEVGLCPACRSTVEEWDKGYSCTAGREKCGFIIWKDALKRCKGRKLTARQASDLLAGKAITLKGLTSKEGKKFDCMGVLGEYQQPGGKSGWGVNLRFEKDASSGRGA